MAELNVQAGGSRHKGALRQRKKLTTRVDLTPMVDLGFLLITFFIITTTLSESKAMKFFLPAGDEQEMPVMESVALTIMPVQGDRIFFYHGNLQHALSHSLYGVTGYHIDSGIGEIIRQKIHRLTKNGKPGNEQMMLIIKPTNEATYKNVVDAMDEVLINDVKRYAVTAPDVTELEKISSLGLK
jgi:biopolymer transport protein ExbD